MSLFKVTQCLLLEKQDQALPGESWPSKTRIKNVNKFHLSRSVAPNSQLITKFDYHAAVSLPDDIQECLWIQEATGEVWISVKQDIIDTAVNEWRKCLCHSVPVFAQWANISINFTAGIWKIKQLDKVLVKLSKMWTKCVFVRYLD